MCVVERDCCGHIVGLAQDAEHKREDGILWVDGGEPVVAAFVRIDDKIGIVSQEALRHRLVVGNALNLARMVPPG